MSLVTVLSFLAVLDQGSPFDPSAEPSYCPSRVLDMSHVGFSASGIGLYLIRHVADHMSDQSRARRKEMRLTKYLPNPHITEHLAKEELTYFSEDEPPAPQQNYTIRPLLAKEAIIAIQCLYRAYGYSYPDDYMYYPERIVHMNETGELTSVVAG